MTMHPLIEQKRIEIAHICQRLGIEKLEVFGSAARGADFDPAHSAMVQPDFDENSE